MFKKSILGLFVLAMTLTLCVFVGSCNKHSHKPVLVEAVAASCETAGNTAYYTCDCGKYFADAEGKVEIEEGSWVVAAKGHTLTAHAAEAATHDAAGNTAYWSCTCGKYFSDAQGQNVIAANSWVVAATGHKATLTAYQASSASCEEDGNTAYWACSCGKYFSDAEGTVEIAENSWVIAATGHTLTAHGANAASCEAGGNSAYWSCACGKYFSDAEGTVEVTENSWVIAALGHKYQQVAAQDPTAEANGNIEYYTCSGCTKKFLKDGETYTEYTGDLNVYYVALNKDGGSGDELTKYVPGVGATLPTLTKDHYNFIGWYDNAEFTGDAVTAIGTDATGAKAYYAKFEIVKFTVTFNVDGGELVVGGNKVTSMEVAYGTPASNLNELVPTKFGHTYSKWTVKVDTAYVDIPAEAIIEANTEVKAVYTPNTYNYVVNNGTTKTIKEVVFGQPVELPTLEQGTYDNLYKKNVWTVNGDVVTSKFVYCYDTDMEFVAKVVEVFDFEAGYTYDINNNNNNPNQGHWNSTRVVSGGTNILHVYNGARGIFALNTDANFVANGAQSLKYYLFNNWFGFRFGNGSTSNTFVQMMGKAFENAACEGVSFDIYCEHFGGVWKLGVAGSDYGAVRKSSLAQWTAVKNGWTTITIDKDTYEIMADAIAESAGTNFMLVFDIDGAVYDEGYSFNSYNGTDASTSVAVYMDNIRAVYAKDAATTETHALTYVAPVAATSEAEGMQGYWYCAECNKYYAGKQGHVELTEAELVTPKLHNLTEHAAKAKTCTTDGNTLYYSCSCGKYFSDANHENEIEKDSWVIAASHDTLVKTDALAATNTADGNKEYYTCPTCGTVFKDAAGTTQWNGEPYIIAKGTITGANATDSNIVQKGGRSGFTAISVYEGESSDGDNKCLKLTSNYSATDTFSAVFDTTYLNAMFADPNVVGISFDVKSTIDKEFVAYKNAGNNVRYENYGSHLETTDPVFTQIGVDSTYWKSYTYPKSAWNSSAASTSYFLFASMGQAEDYVIYIDNIHPVYDTLDRYGFDNGAYRVNGGVNLLIYKNGNQDIVILGSNANYALESTIKVEGAYSIKAHKDASKTLSLRCNQLDDKLDDNDYIAVDVLFTQDVNPKGSVTLGVWQNGKYGNKYNVNTIYKAYTWNTIKVLKEDITADGVFIIFDGSLDCDVYFDNVRNIYVA